MIGHKKADFFEFDAGKAIAAIGFLVSKTGSSMYTIMKMMYLADKLHLERYGRFIAGDTYFAMEQGPVPSRTYDLIKQVREGASNGAKYPAASRYFSYSDDHKIGLLVTPDLDELSASDVECLDEIVSIHQKVGQWAIRDMSHDDAWKAAWTKFFRISGSVPMSIETIAEHLDSGEELLKHLQDTTPGEAKLPAGRGKAVVGSLS